MNAKIYPLHGQSTATSLPPISAPSSTANIPQIIASTGQNFSTVTRHAYFHRTELGQILNVYGFMVSAGHWKDYAVDQLKDRAVFSIYRRASEQPLYQIIKRPALRNKQGQYSVIAPGGLILKRGHDLKAVLRVFDRQRIKSLS